MSKDSLPCGAWPSEVGSADLVRGSLRLSAPRIASGQLLWLEGRPSEGGRQVLMAAALSTSGPLTDVREVGPGEVNVRTRVHEYGGGEFAVSGQHVFFVDDRDRRIHVSDLAGGPTRPISNPDPDANFADLVCSPDGGWLLAVEERASSEREPENRLVAFALGSEAGSRSSGPASPLVIARGHDFYASPVFSPGGDRLAFIAWDHPRMPWQGTVLETLDWTAGGPRGQIVQRAGGPTEAIVQPRFAADGALFAVSDRSGWWNLVRIGESGPEPAYAVEAEWGRAQWIFGISSWTFLGNRQVLASATHDGSDEWMQIDLESGDRTSWPTELNLMAGLVVEDDWLACIGHSSTSAGGVFLGRHSDRSLRCVRESSDLEFDGASISRAEARCFVLPGGRSTHAFVYAPTSRSATSRPGERPPLLVKSHGGPTSSTSAALDPRIQYWTSRGFAVADVNYGGSTGYGRAYRDLLAGAWGVVDVEDCVGVAEALADEGLVDRERLAISGGSAGGYTTLCALTFHSAFAAGASHYGIGDLSALARDTHKFESRYTDWLVGVWPEDREIYEARSPIHHAERLACPVIFFQGLEDKVVPPNQAEAMVAVLAERGLTHAYVPFAGEQHGFRRAENIRTALDGELYFYSRVFGFEAPRPAAVEVVGGTAG